MHAPAPANRTRLVLPPAGRPWGRPITRSGGPTSGQGAQPLNSAEPLSSRINSGICRTPLKPSSQRRVLSVGLHVLFGRLWTDPSRWGQRGSLPGQRDVWGPRHRSKILNRLFQMAFFLASNMHKISFLGRGSVPDPVGGAYDLPQTP